MATRLIYGFLCDDARTEEGTNKDIIIGIFDRFRVGNFEAPLPRFVVFARIGLDDNAEHAFRIDLQAPGDAQIPLIPGQIHPGSGINPIFNQPVFRCRVRLDNLMLVEHGRHAFVLHVDEQPIGEIPFFVSSPDEPRLVLPSEPPPS